MILIEVKLYKTAVELNLKNASKEFWERDTQINSQIRVNANLRLAY